MEKLNKTFNDAVELVTALNELLYSIDVIRFERRRTTYELRKLDEMKALAKHACYDIRRLAEINDYLMQRQRLKNN